MKVDLSRHYTYSHLLRSMAPMILMMLVISIYGIVDGLFISNFAGSDAFAGMNLIWPVIAVVAALGTMMGTGGSALVSKTFGEGNPEKACGIFTMIIEITVLIGISLSVVIFALMPWIADILGASDVMKPYAVLYGRILIVVLPAYMLQMAFQPFFMVAESPQLGTILSIASGVTNMVLDALFVAVFGWGLAGAAVASSMSLLVGGGVPIWFFASGRNKSQLRFIHSRFDWKSLAKSCTNGLSEFVGSISLSIVSICYNLQLMRYIGANGVSAYGVIMYISFIFAAIFIGYNMGVTQIIAFNYGAQNKAEMKSLLNKSLILVCTGGVILTLIAEFLSPLIAKAFVGYDTELCTLTVSAMRIYMICFLFTGINMFTSAWFTALNNGIVSAIASFVRTLGFELVSVFVLPAVIGISGIWHSVNVAEFLSLILSFSLILGFRRRYGY